MTNIEQEIISYINTDTSLDVVCRAQRTPEQEEDCVLHLIGNKSIEHFSNFMSQVVIVCYGDSRASACNIAMKVIEKMSNMANDNNKVSKVELNNYYDNSEDYEYRYDITLNIWYHK